MATFVLVHGAWHGSWCWEAVARALQDDGHRVLTPTLTGLGDRRHLLTRAVDVDAHARDVVETLVDWEVQDAILVAHSYAGVPCTVAAVDAADQLERLVVVDGFVPEQGEAAIDLLPEHAAAHYRDAVVDLGGVAVIPPRPVERLGVTDPTVLRELPDRLRPHPLATYTQPISRGASQLTLAGTYLQCVGWASPFDHMRRRAESLGWVVDELQADHEVMLTAPQRLLTALRRLPRTAGAEIPATEGR